MNRSLPLLVLAALLLFLPLVLNSCTTVQNYRSLYFPQTVWGPYTRMLHHGIPKPAAQQGTADSSDSDSDGKKVLKPQE